MLQHPRAALVNTPIHNGRFRVLRGIQACLTGLPRLPPRPAENTDNAMPNTCHTLNRQQSSLTKPVDQTDPGQPRHKRHSEEQDGDQNQAGCRHIEHGHQRHGDLAAKHATGVRSQSKEGIQAEQAATGGEEKHETTGPKEEQWPVKIRVGAPVTIERDRAPTGHEREEPGQLAEKGHQQAGQPGTTAPGIIGGLQVMTDAGPAGIRRIMGHQRHYQVHAQHDERNQRTFTPSLGQKLPKTGLAGMPRLLLRLSGFTLCHSVHLILYPKLNM